MATASILQFPALTATPQPPMVPFPTRRRATAVQGRALEVLGHAIEYMIDSRLLEGGPSSADNQAIRLMMMCSRSIFDEAVEVVPVYQRLGDWVQQRLRKRGLA